VTVSYEELLAYWQRELPEERVAEIEEGVFGDEEVARRLDLIARLQDGMRRLVAAGKVQAGMTVEAVESLAAQGLVLRTYEIAAGQTVPCSIDMEDLVVVRLEVDFGDVERVDVVMQGTFGGAPPALERYDDVLVDRGAGEVVLVYPGDRIRALPRSQFRYTVSAGGRTLGEYGMDHTP
jgi:hypothetical protein